jgi:protein-tyrosine sulfotransferase
MKNFAFICGAARSGTTLLSNLLNGHPETYVLPVASHVLVYWNYHRQNNSLERFFTRDYLNADEIQFLTNKVTRKEQENYVAQQYGVEDYFKWNYIEQKTFIDRYKGSLSETGVTLSGVYNALFKGAMPAEEYEDGNKLLIERRPLHNEICAVLLHREFPNAKFVHIIRDPRTRYISAKMRRVCRRLGFSPKQVPSMCGENFPTAFSASSMVSLELAKLNKMIIGDNYYIFHFEDLIKSPETTMKEIARHLGIKFSETLLQQTSGEKKQVGFSSMDKPIGSGPKDISDQRLELFFKNTRHSERKILSLLTWEIANYFNYDVDPVEELAIKDLMVPFKWEGPNDYFQNRYYLLKHMRGKSFVVKNNHYLDLLNRFDRGIQVCG